MDIKATFDSGAVMHTSICFHTLIMSAPDSKRGIEYEVASGESIANLGERHCQVMTVGSMAPKRIIVQIADVHKPLLSITACSDMGNE